MKKAFRYSVVISLLATYILYIWSNRLSRTTTYKSRSDSAEYSISSNSSIMNTNLCDVIWLGIVAFDRECLRTSTATFISCKRCLHHKFILCLSKNYITRWNCMELHCDKKCEYFLSKIQYLKRNMTVNNFPNSLVVTLAKNHFSSQVSSDNICSATISEFIFIKF